MFCTRKHKRRFKRMVEFQALISVREFLRMSFYLCFLFLDEAEKDRLDLLVIWSLVKEFHNFHGGVANKELGVGSFGTRHVDITKDLKRRTYIASDDHLADRPSDGSHANPFSSPQKSFNLSPFE